MLTLYCDGSCARTPTNPIGGMSWAWIIRQDGDTLAYARDGGGSGTHVEAEYLGLIGGLRGLLGLASSLGYTGPAEVIGDNEAVINQVAGAWRCSADNLVQLRDEAAGLVTQLAAAGIEVTLDLVMSGENLADALLRPPLKQARRKRKLGRLTQPELGKLLTIRQAVLREPRNLN